MPPHESRNGLGGAERPYAQRVTKRSRTAVLVAVATIALVVPNVVFAGTAATTATGLIGLGALGLAFVTLLAGVRMGLIASGVLAVLSGVAVVAGSHVASAVAVMIVVAFAQALSSRVHLEQAVTVLAITLAFIVAEDPTQEPLSSGFVLGLVMGGYGAAVCVITGIVRSRLYASTPSSSPAATPSPLPWPRVWGYGIALAVAATATTTIALVAQWGHTGGWLIMTPFIVMRPYLRDGWRKAISRGLGTIGGFALAMVLALVFGSGYILTFLGVAFAVLAAYAMTNKWSYTIYALFLTPAIVIIESAGRPIARTADNRLEATLIAIAIVLVIAAAAMPIAHYLSKRAAQHQDET